MQYPALDTTSSNAAQIAPNDNQWQSLCLAWMVALSPSINAAEAGRIVAAACTIGTLRNLTPEDAAERLLSHPVVRAS